MARRTVPHADRAVLSLAVLCEGERGRRGANTDPQQTSGEGVRWDIRRQDTTPDEANCFVRQGTTFDEGIGIGNRRDGFIEIRIVIDACDPRGVRRAGVGERQESEQQQHGDEHIRTPEGVTGMSANAR